MRKFIKQPGRDPDIKTPNDSAPAMFGHLNTIVDEINNSSGSSKVEVFRGLVANGTNASNALVLKYGVNVIETSTNINRACKLPQPVTGKKVTVVNISALPIQVFPSNVGGQINNLPIDTPLAIPADGKPYDFICIENPLPGAWTVSAPATGQLEFDEITIPHTTGSNTYAVGYSPSTITYAGAGVGYGGPGIITFLGNFKTESTTLKVATIKCYTNILETDLQSGNEVIIAVSYGFFSDPSSANLYTPYQISMDAIPGFPNSYDPVYPVLTGPVNSPAQVGDLNTLYAIYSYSVFNTDSKIGPAQYSNYYFTFRMNILSGAATKDYKFKWFIEYF